MCHSVCYTDVINTGSKLRWERFFLLSFLLIAFILSISLGSISRTVSFVFGLVPPCGCFKAVFAGCPVVGVVNTTGVACCDFGFDDFANVFGVYPLLRPPSRLMKFVR